MNPERSSADRALELARKRPFDAQAYTVRGLESPADLARLRDGLVAFYEPIDAVELFAVEHIALAKLSLSRCARIEAGLIALAAQGRLDADSSRPGKSSTMETFRRYQTGAERIYRNAIRGFLLLRGAKRRAGKSSQAARGSTLPPSYPIH